MNRVKLFLKIYLATFVIFYISTFYIFADSKEELTIQESKYLHRKFGCPRVESSWREALDVSHCYEVRDANFNKIFPAVALYYFDEAVTGESRATFAKWKNKSYKMPVEINKLLIDCGIKFSEDNKIALAKAYIIASNIEEFIDRYELGKAEENEFYLSGLGNRIKGSLKIPLRAYISSVKGCNGETPAREENLVYEFVFLQGQFRAVNITGFKKARRPCSFPPMLDAEEEIK